MPGRNKTGVTALFKDVKGDSFKTSRVKCILCSTVLSKNGTRMVKHIKNCVQCTHDIKKKYLSSEKYEVGTIMTVYSTPRLNLLLLYLLYRFIIEKLIQPGLKLEMYRCIGIGPFFGCWFRFRLILCRYFRYLKGIYYLVIYSI